ncbi:MAG TPA: hypothetical protein VHA74_01150, partial [Candidatus Dojkabacteria bacterium]|nr:hypothetical protein [Candidatus Dojkabacteria bacterium]
MINIKGKQYSIIFFDWLNTLYSSESKSLFPWVTGFFESSAVQTKNYLVTHSNNTNQDLEDGVTVPIANYFERIYMNVDDKEKVFA